MKRELWPRVKVGSFVIYADEYDGVHRAKVVETDIKIYEPGTPTRWGYPYGKTSETGTVRIQYDERRLIHNLAELVPYSPWKLGRLRKAWNTYQSAKATAESYREAFLTRVAEYRG